jgi:hypothetical protein
MKYIKGNNQKGVLLIGVLIFSAVAIMTVTAFVSWGITSNKLANRVQQRETALQIAEAGIEYARWYLAHYQTGYTLGNTGSGPYVYNFTDKNGTVIGTYTLTITPPPSGSTLVKIKSTGATIINPSITRSIIVHLAIPSFAKYAVVANADMRFGSGTVIYGPIHSNGGIRFDGVAYNKVTSAKSTYDDPDHTSSSEYGVHTHLNTNSTTVNDSFRPAEAPPSTVAARTDVFKAGREFPVPAVDFSAITADLATIKSQAQSSGRYIGPSGAQGYQIILKTNDTFDVYRVNSQMNANGQCNNPANETGWGTWSINAKQFVANYAIPANGLIFVEDNVWVEGQINSARITIAAALFPDNASTRKNIIVNNDLKYTNYDGTDVVALIAIMNARHIILVLRSPLTVSLLPVSDMDLLSPMVLAMQHVSLTTTPISSMHHHQTSPLRLINIRSFPGKSSKVSVVYCPHDTSCNKLENGSGKRSSSY